MHEMLFGYVLHLSILIIYKLYKNKCNFYVRPNVVVVVDSNVNVVYRISLNDYGLKSIKNNFEFLLKYSKNLEIPDPINITYNAIWSTNNKIVVSNETKLNSREFHINNINNEIVIKVFSQLTQFYEKYLNISFAFTKTMIDEYDHLYIYYHQDWIDKLLILKNIINYKLSLFTGNKEIKSVLTIIHGDLTFRNILKSNNIAFIDFDRSDLNYPEYDYFLFIVDLYTYKQHHKPTYINFFDNLLMFTINDNILSNEIDKFYEINNKFFENKKILRIIKFFLLYRTLLFTLLNFRINEAEPVVIIDKCLRSIQNYEN